jgi:transcriptional regulator GlxA family with amidase domain
VRGALHEDVHGVAYRGGVGDVVIKPAGTRHANTFDRARIICLDADPRGLDISLDKYAWHRNASVTAAAMRVAVGHLQSRDIGQDVDDLLAALAPANDSAIATKAARALDEQFADAVSVDALARGLGVHRVYLARVFRARWGCSPREYLQRVRLRAVADGLTTTSRALADLALDAGFSDQAHMSRIFARTFRTTPAAFRRMARGS